MTIRPTNPNELVPCRRGWRLVASLLSAAALAGVAGASIPADAQPQDSLDWRTAPNALNLELRASADPDGSVVFRWELGAESEDVVCSIDPDGDGVFEESIPDCDQVGSLSYTYEDGGVYRAVMVARSRDGRSGRSTTTVEVEG